MSFPVSEKYCTFTVAFPGEVCTAEPVEKYGKACCDEAAAVVVVYNTGGRAASSSAISGKNDNSVNFKMVYSK